MALKKAISYKTINLPEAFFRVVLPQIEFSGDSMTFTVWAYASQEAAADPSNLLADAAALYSGVPYTLAGADPFTQAYAYLKTLPEFAEAVEVS